MNCRQFDHIFCCVCLLAFILVAPVGCSEQSQRYPIAGKILIDGEPVTKGSIQFVPDTGRPFASKIASDGSFRLVEASLSSNNLREGITPGKYRIGISSQDMIDEDKVHNHIPLHYADYRKSELEVEVNAPNEDMVIKLTWEGVEQADVSDNGESNNDEDSSEDQIVHRLDNPTQEDVQEPTEDLSTAASSKESTE